MTTQLKIDSKRSDLFNVNPDDVTIIGLDTNDGPDHPLFDPRVHLPVEPALVANVRALGVIQPVRLQLDGNRYLVVVGRQRVRALREANAQIKAEGGIPLPLPAILERGNTKRTLGLVISENELRRDDSPLVKAEKAARLRDIHGMTIPEIGVLFGVSDATVRNWLKLDALPAPIRAEVERGNVNAQAALEVAKAPLEAQEAALEAVKGGGKAAKVKALARGKGEPPTLAELRKAISLFDKGEEVSETEAQDLADLAHTLGLLSGDTPVSAVKGLERLLNKIRGA